MPVNPTKRTKNNSNLKNFENKREIEIQRTEILEYGLLKNSTIVFSGLFDSPALNEWRKYLASLIGARSVTSISGNTSILVLAEKLQDGRLGNEGKKYQELLKLQEKPAKITLSPQRIKDKVGPPFLLSEQEFIKCLPEEILDKTTGLIDMSKLPEEQRETKTENYFMKRFTSSVPEKITADMFIPILESEDTVPSTIPEEEKNTIPLIELLNIKKSSSNKELRHLSPDNSLETIKANIKPDNNSIPWVEKFKPRVASDLVGNRNAITSARKAIEAVLNGKNQSPILFYGPPGIGKTSTAMVIAKEMKLKATYTSASDQRKQAGLGLLLKNLRNKPVTGERGHILIIDEIDGLHGNSDRGAVPILLQGIPGNARVPIICISNTIEEKKILSLVKKSTKIFFGAPTATERAELVNKISHLENIPQGPDLVRLVEDSGADMRKLIQNLQQYKFGTKYVASEVDESLELNIGLSRLSKPLSVAESREIFFLDYDKIPLIMPDIVVSARLNRLKARKSLRALAKSSKSLNILKEDNNWTLINTVARLTTGVCGNQLINERIIPPRFPFLWSKIGTLKKNHSLFSSVRSDDRYGIIEKEYIALLLSVIGKNASFQPSAKIAEWLDCVGWSWTKLRELSVQIFPLLINDEDWFTLSSVSPAISKSITQLQSKIKAKSEGELIKSKR